MPPDSGNVYRLQIRWKVIGSLEAPPRPPSPLLEATEQCGPGRGGGGVISFTVCIGGSTRKGWQVFYEALER